MKLSFYKYQGTGNDFILVDNRSGGLNKSQTDLIQRLCQRRFGIGADGLMLLQNVAKGDFEMVYFNSDGREGSMCGNGGRCIVAFAKYLKIIDKEAKFLAVDGWHYAKINEEGNFVELQMNNVKNIYDFNTRDYVLDTGSPHYVTYVNDVAKTDVVPQGKSIRYSPVFQKQGINVNFVQPLTGSTISVRTYERGVEDETYSCGTGVVACAIIHHLKNNAASPVSILTPGGELTVRFESKDKKEYSDIWLCGPATQVFAGEIII